MSDVSELVSSSGPLLEAAVKPFGDNLEQQLTGIQFLENIKTSSDGEDAVISRWNKVDAKKHRRLRRYGLWLLLIAASTAVWLMDAGDWLRYSSRSYLSEMRVNTEPWGHEVVVPDMRIHAARHLSIKDRLLLNGHPMEDYYTEQKEALWRSNPDKPAFFSDYATACAGSHHWDRLGADFLETAARIDPDNAWFTLLAAGAEAYQCGEIRLARDKPPVIRIHDQGRLERSLALLRKAREQPKCESYQASMLRMRIPLVKQRTPLEASDGSDVLAHSDAYSTHLKLTLSLPLAIAAQAESYADQRDVMGLTELARDTQAFLRKIHGMEGRFLRTERAYVQIVNLIGRSFAPAAEKLGLADESARWKLALAGLAAMQEKFHPRADTKFLVDGTPAEEVNRPGTLWRRFEYSGSDVEHPPLLTHADIRPGQLADFHQRSWFMSLLLWLSLGIGMGVVALHRFRVTHVSRILATRMGDLFRPTDWIWVVGLGVVGPLTYLMVVLSARNFRLNIPWLRDLLVPMSAHFFALLLLMPVTLVITTRWRLAKRAKLFGFPHSSWWDWIALISLVGLVPVAEQAALIQQQEPTSDARWNLAIATTLLIAVPILWLFLKICLALFGRATGQFRLAAISMLLVRAYAMAMLVALAASVGFKAATEYWCARDTWMKADASVPCLNRYEHHIAVQYRKEINEALEPSGFDE